MITALAALLCACLARAVRSLPKEEQTNGTLFVLAILVGFLVYVAIAFVWRSFLEKKAGKSQFFSRGSLKSFFHISGLFNCLLCLGCMIASLLLLTDKTSSSTCWSLAIQFCLFGAWSINYLLSVFVWKVDSGSIDVRDEGLLLGVGHFVPWDFLHGFRWNKFTNKLMLLNENGFTEWPVVADRKAELHEEIEKYLPYKESALS